MAPGPSARRVLDEAPVLQTLTIARAAGTEPESMRLPHSVHSIIAARLDTLSQSQKTVLTNAAVFDRVVWADPVAAINDLDPEAVAEHLRHLEQRGFLGRTRLRSSPGRIKYEFRHNLVRDVADAQLPRPESAAKHARCATWLETSREGHPGLLQHHRKRSAIT
jgi:predicted ATPase